MWFKYGRPEALSPGQRPGLLSVLAYRPVRAKALKLQTILRLLPLQGALLTAIIPRALPWAKSFCPFKACGAYFLNLVTSSKKLPEKYSKRCRIPTNATPFL